MKTDELLKDELVEATEQALLNLYKVKNGERLFSTQTFRRKTVNIDIPCQPRTTSTHAICQSVSLLSCLLADN